MKKGSHFFEWTHKRANGEEFFATVLLTRMELEGKKVLQATVRDITQEKKTKLELEKKIEELERFNKIAVGRDLRMVELKDKIRELEKRLK
ncbi:MAG: PAS domain S-box protein [Elusimicrobia bacterium]|nr:PAS domain S-box protein [Elusimicrobiota bacterium]